MGKLRYRVIERKYDYVNNRPHVTPKFWLSWELDMEPRDERVSYYPTSMSFDTLDELYRFVDDNHGLNAEEIVS